MLDNEALKAWFLSEKRDLPWRRNPSPYAVWVSEVMLQQTQVAVVIPYFERWMEHFPTIKKLAEASLDEVIKMWEGLGYYSRARFLHDGARFVLENYGGELPREENLLGKIKGLGPYTIGAIRSFAFHERATAVDGNVLRVLTRYFKIEEDISKPRVVAMIREMAEKILPQAEPWVTAEALIELGATICQRIPQCERCPLRSSCDAYRHGVAHALPIKSAKMKTHRLFRAVAVIFCQGYFLIRRGAAGEIMADLHEFPYFEVSHLGIDAREFQKKIDSEWGLRTSLIGQLPLVKHSFTRYEVSLFPTLLQSEEHQLVEGYQWLASSHLKQLAFSSGHRRILNSLGDSALVGFVEL
jgi:A/G-specific adenine glycosylase